MDSADRKGHQENHKFDWDDISVGNLELDHSQNFFKNQNAPVANKIDSKEFVAGKCISPVKQNETIADTSPIILKVRNEDTREVKEESCCKVVANLASEWSSKKTKVLTSKGAVSKSMPPPPQAYLIKDIYKRNRQEAERRRLEEERKLREFHSRPAPKFNQNQLLQKRGSVHAVTVAVTPQVLKKSIEADEKRKKRLEEWKQKNQPPKFESRPPTVLKEKPFVPEKKPVVVQQCPFKLQTENRLKERKLFDEIKQKALEEKQKQEEEERKKLEKEHIKELRKAATFKARPNPFKK